MTSSDILHEPDTERGWERGWHQLRAENIRLKQRVQELEAAKQWLVQHLAATRLRREANGQAGT